MRNLTRTFGRGFLAGAFVLSLAAAGQAGEITVDLTTDIFGGETAWQLVEVSSGNVIDSRAQGTLTSSTNFVDVYPGLDPGDYDFTITDSFGDGICCLFGLGDYSITADGVTTPSPTGGAFTSTETVTVTVTEKICNQPASSGCTVNGKTGSCNGTMGTDVIIGTNGPDVIKGRGGDDYLVGLDGNDILCGAGGDDVLIGGDGGDYADGGSGDDILEGLGGNDRLRGGSGSDALDGGSGNDDCRDNQASTSFRLCEQILAGP